MNEPFLGQLLNMVGKSLFLRWLLLCFGFEGEQMLFIKERRNLLVGRSKVGNVKEKHDSSGAVKYDLF